MSTEEDREAWTPSTEQVRSHYVFNQSNQWDPERGKAFDRWLASVRTPAPAPAPAPDVQALIDFVHDAGLTSAYGRLDAREVSELNAILQSVEVSSAVSTPQVTDAMVESGGRALYENRVADIDSDYERAQWPSWVGLDVGDANEWRTAARVALEAALGVSGGVNAPSRDRGRK